MTQGLSHMTCTGVSSDLGHNISKGEKVRSLISIRLDVETHVLFGHTCVFFNV